MEGAQASMLAAISAFVLPFASVLRLLGVRLGDVPTIVIPIRDGAVAVDTLVCRADAFSGRPVGDCLYAAQFALNVATYFGDGVLRRAPAADGAARSSSSTHARPGGGHERWDEALFRSAYAAMAATTRTRATPRAVRDSVSARAAARRGPMRGAADLAPGTAMRRRARGAATWVPGTACTLAAQ
ncbi:hypothetical protein ACP4OV_023176 [Aristida adscensionis]